MRGCLGISAGLLPCGTAFVSSPDDESLIIDHQSLFLSAVLGEVAAWGEALVSDQVLAFGSGVRAGPFCTSNEPMSMRLLRTRQKSGPRWS
jgi:hypothetical protein